MKENVFKGERQENETIQCGLFLGIGIVLMVYSLHNHKEAGVEWAMSPYLFPLLISVFLLLLSTSHYIQIQRQRKQDFNENAKSTKNTRWKILGVTVSFLCVYYFLMPLIGFFFSGVLFLAAMFWLLGERRIWLIGILSIGMPALLYGLFHKLLHVMLP